MIVVFEGPNSVGKTVYAKKFSEKYNIPLIDFGLSGNPELSNNEISLIAKTENDLFASIFEKVTTDAVVDRLYASDFVYSQLKRRKFNLVWYEELEKRLEGKIYHVYLRCLDFNELLKRRIENNERYISEEEIFEEIFLYDSFFYNFTSIPFIEIDTTERSKIDVNLSLIHSNILFKSDLKAN